MKKISVDEKLNKNQIDSKNLGEVLKKSLYTQNFLSENVSEKWSNNTWKPKWMIKKVKSRKAKTRRENGKLAPERSGFGKAQQAGNGISRRRAQGKNSIRRRC